VTSYDLVVVVMVVALVRLVVIVPVRLAVMMLMVVALVLAVVVAVVLVMMAVLTLVLAVAVGASAGVGGMGSGGCASVRGTIRMGGHLVGRRPKGCSSLRAAHPSQDDRRQCKAQECYRYRNRQEAAESQRGFAPSHAFTPSSPLLSMAEYTYPYHPARG
jgi:hypothetical protein